MENNLQLINDFSEPENPVSFVDGYNHLVRDEITNAILNTNFDEYKNYLEMKSIKEQENARIDSLENDLINIKGDIGEIKDLLRSLLK